MPVASAPEGDDGRTSDTVDDAPAFSATLPAWRKIAVARRSEIIPRRAHALKWLALSCDVQVAELSRHFEP
ncbi:hypothetical protein BvCmsKKP038_02213 [Escherichia coli]|nr:hypothetical protein BvCmsKKP038_02213 [Escherichia coli]